MARPDENNTLPYEPPGHSRGIGPPNDEPPPEPPESYNNPDDPYQREESPDWGGNVYDRGDGGGAGEFDENRLRGLMDDFSDSDIANRNYGVGAGQASATTRGVGREELSQYQLEQMLASDSPLMRQAAEQGLARAGSRGLMNSSLGIGASQGAMISQAQPFAIQDAKQYGITASENMQAQNEAAMQNARETTVANIAGMEAGAARDKAILEAEAEGFADIRKGLMDYWEREDEQAWKTSEAEAGRSWQTGERLGTQEFQWATEEQRARINSLDREDQQAFKALSQDDQQAFLKLQQDDQQMFLKLQQDDQQYHLWKSQLSSQDWQAEQNTLNRAWTTNENISRDMLAWAQTKVDAAVRLGISREATFADMYSAIMMNENPKFKGTERDAAVRKIKAELDGRYGAIPLGDYEKSYDPSRGTMPQPTGEVDENGNVITDPVDGTDPNDTNFNVNPITGNRFTQDELDWLGDMYD